MSITWQDVALGLVILAAIFAVIETFERDDMRRKEADDEVDDEL